MLQTWPSDLNTSQSQKERKKEKETREKKYRRYCQNPEDMVQIIIQMADHPGEWRVVELQGQLEARDEVSFGNMHIGNLHFDSRGTPNTTVTQGGTPTRGPGKWPAML